MLSIDSNRRYFFCTAPTDMRRGFDSLCGLVRSQMGKNPISTDVFIFLNARRTHVKLLIWEGDGIAIYYKRLEKGTYELPGCEPDQTSIHLYPHQLQFILQGVCLASVKRRKRLEIVDK